MQNDIIADKITKGYFHEDEGEAKNICSEEEDKNHHKNPINEQ